MAVVRIAASAPSASSLQPVVQALDLGGVVAIPTDTVYGLAVNPFRAGAVDRIFQVKGRPARAKLPVLVADLAQCRDLIGDQYEVPEAAAALMERFWPGPLTVVVACSPELAALLGQGDDTIGVRCPDQALARALCAAVGPLAVTSANRHGRPTPITADEVAAIFGEAIAMVLDAGPCGRVPSTVVDCRAGLPTLVREGALSWEAVGAALRAHNSG